MAGFFSISILNCVFTYLKKLFRLRDYDRGDRLHWLQLIITQQLSHFSTHAHIIVTGLSHDYLILRLLCTHHSLRGLTQASSVSDVHEVCCLLDVMRGVFVSTPHELQWVCVSALYVLPLGCGQTAAAAVTHTEQMGSKGCQNCAEWKARSEVVKAVTRPATLECHSQRHLFLSRLGPHGSLRDANWLSKALVL